MVTNVKGVLQNFVEKCEDIIEELTKLLLVT